MNEKVAKLRGSMQQRIVGKEQVIDRLIVSLLAGGHVLLEDVPGVGKTSLAKALSDSLSLSFSRIQCTPDTMPSDITGLSIYHMEKGEFEVLPGPIVNQIVLADEINRTSPKTQASLLEAMEERQVTIDGNTIPIPEPFMVIGTQNPMEMAGTYPLPEAQLDRFMMKLSMGLPDKAQEMEILKRFINGDKQDKLMSLEPIVSPGDIETMRKEAGAVEVHPQLQEYIADIIMATRKRNDVASGVSPRGSLALLYCAKVLAYANDRTYVVPEDIKKLAVPVLAHRLIISGGYGKSGNARQIIESILDEVPVPSEAAFSAQA